MKNIVNDMRSDSGMRGVGVRRAIVSMGVYAHAVILTDQLYSSWIDDEEDEQLERATKAVVPEYMLGQYMKFWDMGDGNIGAYNFTSAHSDSWAAAITYHLINGEYPVSFEAAATPFTEASMVMHKLTEIFTGRDKYGREIGDSEAIRNDWRVFVDPKNWLHVGEAFVPSVMENINKATRYGIAMATGESLGEVAVTPEGLRGLWGQSTRVIPDDFAENILYGFIGQPMKLNIGSMAAYRVAELNKVFVDSRKNVRNLFLERIASNPDAPASAIYADAMSSGGTEHMAKIVETQGKMRDVMYGMSILAKKTGYGLPKAINSFKKTNKRTRGKISNHVIANLYLRRDVTELFVPTKKSLDSMVRSAGEFYERLDLSGDKYADKFESVMALAKRNYDKIERQYNKDRADKGLALLDRTLR